MPKQKTFSPRRSPRKSNNAKNEEKSNVQPIVFVFEGEEGPEMELDPKDELMCLSTEESENENEVPSAAGRTLSPLKRASPLSPTLIDNFQQVQQPTNAVPLPNPLASPGSRTAQAQPGLAPPDIPKIDSDSESVTEERFRKRKRRRIFSESSVETVDVNDTRAADVPPPVNETPSSRRNKKATSQKTPVQSAVNDSSVPEKVELPKAEFRIIEDYDKSDMDPPMDKDIYINWSPLASIEELCKFVTYESDEVDMKWLEIVNKTRKDHLGVCLGEVSLEEMELLLDRMEKEYYYELQNSGIGQPGESDEDAVCCICLNGESENSNQIIFCDMCNIPVHQDCYGVPFIPEGSWLCRRCQISPHGEIECIFCPSKDGALKQTIDGRWAHVLCALWIPECRFANLSFVEPVTDIEDIPQARWRLVCFLCKKKGVGACIQCHLRSCVTAFHVTCAQAAGLSLKYEAKEIQNTTNVRMSASCDKHTSQRDRDTLTQKWQTVNTVLNEKRCAPAEAEYPKIPAARLEAISELVGFPGKKLFLTRLYAYWKLKRKDKGGAPLLRNPESLWEKGLQYPAAPGAFPRDPLGDDFMRTCYQHMSQTYHGLEKIKEYCGLVKSHSEHQREEIETRIKITSLQIQRIDPVFLDVIDKLNARDKNEFFKEPVTEEEAPDYFTVITHPMDLSTMRNKVFQLEYSSLDEVEADFQLMINNCMKYNKKSTIFHRTAAKLHEQSLLIFHEAREEIKQREIDRLEEEEKMKQRKLIQSTLPAAFFKTDGNKDLKYQPMQMQPVLLKILDQIQKRDAYDIFAEPVDVNEVPEYATIIKNPMDFSRMRQKINADEYFCIDDLEQDFDLMIKNCMEFNEDDSDFYKEAVKLNKFGKGVFEKAKVKHVKVKEETSPLKLEERQVFKAENNNNESCVREHQQIKEISSIKKEDDQDVLYQVMADVLTKLKEQDDQKIFAEPVSLDEASDYLEIIESPMDLSTMESKMDNSEYASLEELEKDFNLMIDNCKKYNPPRSVFYGIAKIVKCAGDKIFRAARKQLQS